jgi:hypothetical protein
MSSLNYCRPIEYSGEQSTFLSKIFDMHSYDELFESANNELLKRERLYKSKEWKLEAKSEWRP